MIWTSRMKMNDCEMNVVAQPASSVSKSTVVSTVSTAPTEPNTPPSGSLYIILPLSFAKSQRAASSWLNGMLPAPRTPREVDGSIKLDHSSSGLGEQLAAAGSLSLSLFTPPQIFRRLFFSFFVVRKCSYFLLPVKPSCLWLLRCAPPRS